MADPAARKALNQNHKKGEIVVNCYLCQISYVKYPWKGLLMPTAFSKPFLVLENAKKIRQKSYLAIMNKSGTDIDYHV